MRPRDHHACVPQTPTLHGAIYTYAVQISAAAEPLRGRRRSQSRTPMVRFVAAGWAGAPRTGCPPKPDMGSVAPECFRVKPVGRIYIPRYGSLASYGLGVHVSIAVNSRLTIQHRVG